MKQNDRDEVFAHILNGLGVLLVLIVILVNLPLSLPKLAGIRVFSVMSGSMEPAYAEGGLVYVQKCDVNQLQVGDVITFPEGSGTNLYVTHRIVEIDAPKDIIRTKGDANDAIDSEPVQKDRIIGKVCFYLPSPMGMAANMEKTRGIGIALTIGITAVICWMLADIIKKQKKALLRLCVRIIAVTLIIGSSCYLGRSLWQYWAGEQEYQQLARKVFEKEAKKDMEVGNQSGILLMDEKEKEVVLSTENNHIPEEENDKAIHEGVSGLMQMNKDMIGWIAFEELDISYPVMQGADNAYYLTHTFSGEKNAAGSIFVDSINHRDWEDAHTICYGHNMKNLSMFGKLRNYKRKDFYNENKYFCVYTDSETYRYLIFAYYDVPEYSDVYTVWYTPDENFEEMIDRMRKQSYYDTDVAVSSEDKILTLSTCSTEGNRFVIHAKRID